MTVSERVAAYAAAYYRAKARWPTLAETAAALDVRMSTIKDCASDGDYEFVGYGTNTNLVEALT